jgi:hypothetical protein
MAYEDDSETGDTPDRSYVTCGVCNQDKEDTMLILGQHRCADCGEDRRRIDLFLTDVARKKGIQPGHVQSWSQAVRVKLAKIELRNVSDVTASVLIINGNLRAARQKEMHNYSLEVIAREGVRNIEKHYRALYSNWNDTDMLNKPLNMPLSNKHVVPETTTKTETPNKMTRKREMSHLLRTQRTPRRKSPRIPFLATLVHQRIWVTMMKACLMSLS